jgi:acetyltransferase AlgX (SGNH hydrolase-like protein)
MRLRFLIPGILLITGVANVALRLLPPDRLALRSWEAVTLFVTNTGPFAPGKHYVNHAATGDLGTLANLPQYRRPHSEVFTTGVHGYRGYEPGVDAPPAAILFGDSFGAGASLSDNDSLCARLRPIFGGPVFFAGYYSPHVPEILTELPRAPFVILQLSERYGLTDRAPANTDFIKTLLRDNSAVYRTVRYWHGLAMYSPLEIWAGRAYRYLQNDAILPNVHAKDVARYTLRNHDELLFLRSEVTAYFNPRAQAAGSLIATERTLRAQGYHVLLILVPNKFTVYYPLLQNAPPSSGEDRLYINVLERTLRAASIPVVNLTPALRRAAADALKNNELVYHSDDTHWNGLGVIAACEEIRKALNQELP